MWVLHTQLSPCSCRAVPCPCTAQEIPTPPRITCRKTSGDSAAASTSPLAGKRKEKEKKQLGASTGADSQEQHPSHLHPSWCHPFPSGQREPPGDGGDGDGEPASAQQMGGEGGDLESRKQTAEVLPGGGHGLQHSPRRGSSGKPHSVGSAPPRRTQWPDCAPGTDAPLQAAAQKGFLLPSMAELCGPTGKVPLAAPALARCPAVGDPPAVGRGAQRVLCV